MATYDLEADLVMEIEAAIRSGHTPFGPGIEIGREFDYSSGRADLVFLSTDAEVFAFEAKLSDWKYALTQAYRNSSFAHRSFVALPGEAASRAIQRRHEFIRRNVGLCVVGPGEFRVLQYPKKADPIQPWLSSKATEFIRRSHVN